MEIRKALKKDSRGIVECNVKTWITTYTGIIPDSILQNRLDNIEDSIKKCEANIEEKDNVFVAIEDEKVVGIVSFGKSKILEEEITGEIYWLYVLNEHHGKRIGEKLFKKAQDELKNTGYKKMLVTCIKQNPSNNFYIKMGGKIIDVINSDICGAKLEENLIVFD